TPACAHDCRSRESLRSLRAEQRRVPAPPQGPRWHKQPPKPATNAKAVFSTLHAFHFSLPRRLDHQHSFHRPFVPRQQLLLRRRRSRRVAHRQFHLAQQRQREHVFGFLKLRRGLRVLFLICQPCPFERVIFAA